MEKLELNNYEFFKIFSLNLSSKLQVHKSRIVDGWLSLDLDHVGFERYLLDCARDYCSYKNRGKIDILMKKLGEYPPKSPLTVECWIDPGLDLSRAGVNVDDYILQKIRKIIEEDL